MHINAACELLKIESCEAGLQYATPAYSNYTRQEL